ncbi:glycosyltransferase [Paenibacillus naphthalenovorans]|uniref:glycosyltransferase n=1 Tax=Paenibacillus naphthalenovorans TaxID=162209 RepID=UPI003D2BFC0F
MNIAIDVLAILGPDSKNRGIGNYTTSQLKKLFEIDKTNRYFLVNFYEETSLKDILNYSENVSEHYFYLGKDGFLGKDKKYKEILGNLIRNFIKAHGINVFYMTSPFDGLISYDMEWFSDVKTVATLYDIIPYIYKEKYLGSKHVYDQYMGMMNNVLKTDKLLAISKSAKEDIIKEFKIDPDKIDVIYAGTDDSFTKINITSSEAENIKNIYNIKDQFIMCTGGDDDRKNIAGLIVAYSKMPKHLIEKYQLVVACKLSQASEAHYYKLASKHNVRDRVILTNFVPQEHLIMLYNLAHVVAFPSQYEGFGLPVVESMACGTPVLTSNNSSLGEISKGAAILVDPFDINDVSKGLIKILENTDLNELVEKGYERIKMFTWKKVAQATLTSLNSLNVEDSKEVRSDKKIAFFTPLPPLQSGISDYSVDILNKLSKFFSIDVYIDKGYKPDCNLSGKINIYEHGNFLSKKDEYKDVIYQMGNSEYHAYMIDYLQKFSGVLVLHDYNLHGLLHFMTSKQNDLDKYKKFLYEDYNKDFVDGYVNDISSGRAPIKIFDLPCNGVVTNYAKKIIVHSDYAKKLLLQKDISRNVKKILLYAKIKEVVDKTEIRKKLKIAENQIVISAFGHIHETKRIMPILKAFNNLSNKHNHIVLYLVGKPSPSIKGELEEYIKVNNMENKVIVTGYMDLNTFEEYIDATDICLNLRYPYNGESSASLMRILSKGKCALINDLGSFSEIPDDCCIKLHSPERLVESDEVDIIMTKLEELLSNPELISSIGNNARKYAQENLDLDDIAEQYAAFINDSVTSNITESMLKELADYIKHSHGENIEDLYRLSRTIAYSKEAEYYWSN